MPELDRDQEESAATGVERRAEERYPCNVRPFWGECGSGRYATTGQVRDISATGIGLLMPCWIRPGQVLVLKLYKESQALTRPLLVRVIHCTRQPDDRWLCGGTFVRRLTEGELQLLLQHGS
jgi:hypothetical protein